MNIKKIEELKKKHEKDQDVAEALDLAKKHLHFNGVLGALKDVLESRCVSYGGEQPGNQCCFRYDMGHYNPCIICRTRATTGYPCPACGSAHTPREIKDPCDELTAEAQRLGMYDMPTGRWWVRLNDDLKLEDFKSELELIGWIIDEIPAYGPNAGWVKPMSESTDSLKALIKMQGVAHVEPQILRPVRRR